MKDRNKMIYWGSTVMLSLLMLGSATMYFFLNDMARESFVNLGYPTYLIYPLAIAKVLGVIAILSKRSSLLKEWAYAGFFFDLVLALMAHVQVADGEYPPAVIGLVLVIVSRLYENIYYQDNAQLDLLKNWPSLYSEQP